MLSKNWIITWVIVFAIIAVFVGLYLFTGDHLTRIAITLTAASIIISPVLYVAKILISASEDKARISKNLLDELNDSSNILNNILNDKVEGRFRVDDNEANDIVYISKFLNHDVYDSLIFSGKINFLPNRSQQTIQDVFNLIKDHNYYLKYAKGIGK